MQYERQMVTILGMALYEVKKIEMKKMGEHYDAMSVANIMRLHRRTTNVQYSVSEQKCKSNH